MPDLDERGKEPVRAGKPPLENQLEELDSNLARIKRQLVFLAAALRKWTKKS